VIDFTPLLEVFQSEDDIRRSQSEQLISESILRDPNEFLLFLVPAMSDAASPIPCICVCLAILIHFHESFRSRDNVFELILPEQHQRPR
jgi:hypothetical protein